MDLIDFAFSPKKPGRLAPVDRHEAEQQGVHQLFRGAIQYIRNPFSHRRPNSNAATAFNILGFISMLADTANEIAMENYVFPFLASRDSIRAIISVKWADIDGDGRDEVAIFFAEQSWVDSSQMQDGLIDTRLLVLALNATDDGTSHRPYLPISSSVPTIRGSSTGDMHIDDLDLDGVSEILVRTLVKTGENAFEHRGLLCVVHDGSVDTHRGISENPLTSHGLPFEFVTQPDGTKHIVGYQLDRSAKKWAFSNGELLEYPH